MAKSSFGVGRAKSVVKKHNFAGGKIKTNGKIGLYRITRQIYILSSVFFLPQAFFRRFSAKGGF
jgi:hypothetical protein